jgi:hypothetical protein
MPLLNYTTQIQVSKTIGEIQAKLVGAGARQIMTTYDDVGAATGLSFALSTPEGTRGFALPVRVAAVLKVMGQDGTPSKFVYVEQAERVAWRILKTWLEGQLAIIETEMVSFSEVMLPYMQMKGNKTMFELYQEDRLPALERGK